jgi:hypothetical protein
MMNSVDSLENVDGGMSLRVFEVVLVGGSTSEALVTLRTPESGNPTVILPTQGHI